MSGLLKAGAAQGNAAPFPSGEDLDRCFPGRAPKSVHGHFEPGVQVPGVHGIDLFLDLALALDELVISSSDMGSANFSLMR